MCQVPATLKASQAEDSEWHGAAPPWLGVGCKRYQWANLTTWGEEQLCLELATINWD